MKFNLTTASAKLAAKTLQLKSEVLPALALARVCVSEKVAENRTSFSLAFASAKADLQPMFDDDGEVV